MCTILLAWDPAAPVSVVLAANRDEFRDRVADDPSAIAQGVFAGRDRQAGGTWLAVSRAGIAALTNVRTGPRDPQAPTRGDLPLAALAGRLPTDFRAYNAFNLLVVDGGGARVVTHEGPGSSTRIIPLAPGRHVIDNDAFGVRSPRALRAADRLRDDAAPTIAHLGDHGGTDDDGLCHHGEIYGTVSAAVVHLGRDGSIERYLYASGPPCRAVPRDLTAAARATVA
jgi:uncharacterized protein with NRDE domain